MRHKRGKNYNQPPAPSALGCARAPGSGYPAPGHALHCMLLRVTLRAALRSPLLSTLRIIPFLASPSARCPRNIMPAALRSALGILFPTFVSGWPDQAHRCYPTSDLGLPAARSARSYERCAIMFADERGPPPYVFRSRPRNIVPEIRVYHVPDAASLVESRRAI